MHFKVKIFFPKSDHFQKIWVQCFRKYQINVKTVKICTVYFKDANHRDLT